VQRLRGGQTTARPMVAAGRSCWGTAAARCCARRRRICAAEPETEHVEPLAVRRETPVADPFRLTATGCKVSIIRRFFAGGIPNAGFAFMKTNPSSVPQRCGEQVVEGANALRQGDDVNIVEEGGNSFSIEELALEVVEGLVLS